MSNFEKTAREAVRLAIHNVTNGFDEGIETAEIKHNTLATILKAHSAELELFAEQVKATIHARAAQIANDPMNEEIQQLKSQHPDGQATINGLAWAHAQIDALVQEFN